MELDLPGFELTDTLASGPVRFVYRAKQTELARPVLLVTHAAEIPVQSPLVRSLTREARLLAQLDHPRIRRLLDYQESKERVLLILEDGDLTPLTQRIPLPLSWREATAVALQIAEALQHAHEKNIFHGALSLRHVFLHPSGHIKVEGFSSSGSIDEEEIELFSPQGLEGSAPETSLGHACTALSDTFAWGALFYELLTAEPPFGSPESQQFPTRVRKATPDPILARAPQTPDSLPLLISQCLNKLPTERPESLLLVIEQLRALLQEPPERVLAAALQPELSKSTQPSAAPSRAPLLWRSLAPSHKKLIFTLLGSFVLLGGLSWAFSHWSSRSPSSLPPAPVSSAPSRDQALRLLVLASPWAHVFVDGQQLETTPFATPLLLSPGTHIVRLEHPHAPPEERKITGEAGQAITLDVVMKVQRPLLPSEPLTPPEDTTP